MEREGKNMLCGLINFFAYFSFMDWCAVDERLIRRGELLLSLDFLNNYDYELSLLNDGKVGRPFKITYGYIIFWLLSDTYSPCLIGRLRVSLGLFIGLFQGFQQ
jgi:hypothetical protein